MLLGILVVTRTRVLCIRERIVDGEKLYARMGGWDSLMISERKKRKSQRGNGRKSKCIRPLFISF